MNLRRIAASVVLVLFAPIAAPAAAADDPAAVRALLERVVDGGQGMLGDAKRARIIVGGLPDSTTLPPLPADARVVGSVVRDVSGTAIFLDVPRPAAVALAAMEKALLGAGYTKSVLSGQGGFSTSNYVTPAFFCRNGEAVSVQGNPGADAASSHVNVTLTGGNAVATICGGATGFAALAASFASSIPRIRPSDGMTIDSSTTGINTGTSLLGAGTKAKPSSAWGHITSAMPLTAVSQALAKQLTDAGWTAAGAPVVDGTTASERFAIPATATAAAGDALLSVTKGPGNTYDAFIRAIVPTKG